MSAIDLISVVAQEFAEDPRLDGMIEIAESQVGEDHPSRQLAIAYMAAHMLVVADRAGTGGAVVSRSEGGLSESYAVAAGSDDLASTSYGKQLSALNQRAYGFSATTGYM